MTTRAFVIADGFTIVEQPPPSPQAADAVYGRVPCVSVCVPGAKCPAAGRAAGECTYSHKPPCLYSSECHNLAEDHRLRFYHPSGNCSGHAGAHAGAPSNCARTDVNHWRSVAHPCAIRGCPKPTVAILNGWVCGYHYKLMTDFYRTRASAAVPKPAVPVPVAVEVSQRASEAHL